MVALGSVLGRDAFGHPKTPQTVERWKAQFHDAASRALSSHDGEEFRPS
jgi:hypothetical protein